MKFLNKLLIPIMIIAIYFAISEQNKSNQNIYIMIIAIAIFMFGMMKLSAKTPSKNPENEENNV
jgi:hypothetical protein